MAKLIGNEPNQVPTNGDLGTMAYQDSDNVVVGNLTVSGDLIVKGEISSGSFTWDSATSSPAAVNGESRVITSIHEGMRRCILNDSGKVVYYLDENDSTKKADGTSANIDGTDGQVMVEIPKFYTRREV
jgi:hypothetical protein